MAKRSLSWRTNNGDLTQLGDGFRVRNSKGTSRVHAVFDCVCGNRLIAREDHVRSGFTTSCGCYQKQRTAEVCTTHGHSVEYHRTTVFNRWHSMVTRCSEAATGEDRKAYFDRGIRVCERWQKFENFLEDMGEPSLGMSIERVDNDGDYCRENCRWASTADQSVNKRNNRFFEFQGKVLCLTDWSRELGVTRGTILRRVSAGLLKEI